jgi:hypothetical protein
MFSKCDDMHQVADPELLLYELNFNRPTIERALDITADYVAQYKLILTGGTAIDMALRSKGTSIYDENALPDYDIISERNLDHASALAEILCKGGIRDINVINAIHITTVRVRCKNITLLDATYLPEVLMNRIPYIDIGKFRLVHPDYQKIDQRLSLATLMADTGQSLNIFNRLTKDIKRNQILREHFATNDSSPVDIKIFSNRIKLSRTLFDIDPTHMDRLDPDCFIYTGDTCISGFLAYALYYYEYCKDRMPLDGTIDPNIKMTDSTIEFDLPKEIGVSILNCNDSISPTLEKLASVKPNTFKRYNALANLKPITFKAELSNHFIEVTDSYGARISSVELEGMVVASTDYVSMQFLRDRIYGQTEYIRNINSMYYESLLKMLLDRQQYDDSSKVWFPSISCYGRDILPEYRSFGFEKIMNPSVANTYKPKNSYLRIPQCQTKSGFDPTTSHYFAIDGQENDQIVHTNLKYVIDKIQTKLDG